jgi:putative NADPH-quinone reductase
MRRLLLNGSPRGKESNSRLILSWIAEGLARAGIESPPVMDLARASEREALLQAFIDADEVVLAFPLYTDSMPALVKGFIESLAAVDPALLRGKRVAFVVQSGFPEAIQTEAVAAYLARLSIRLAFVHVGTINKGGMEGIRVMPAYLVSRTRAGFIRAGCELAEIGQFSPALVSRMAGRRRLSLLQVLVYRALSRLGVLNLYWNSMLKKHGAFDRRFDAPFAGAYRGSPSPALHPG